jgi:hypothetical protein
VIAFNLYSKEIKMDENEASHWFNGCGDDEESYNDITEQSLRG